MPIELKALIVDDSENDTLLLVRQLKKGGFTLDYIRVESRDALSEALNAEAWDVVITDHNLPGFNSAASLKLIKEFDDDIPVIIVSGTIDEDVAIVAMQGGAADYIMKDNLSRLVPAITRELKESNSRRAKRKAEIDLRHMAYHDPLTNLVNRTLFRDRLEHALMRSRSVHFALSGFSRVALILIGLDRFKVMNDSLGHDVGDLILKEVAARLMNVTAPGDTVARFGGDEFMVLIEDCGSEADVSIIAQKILAAINEPLYLRGNEVFIGACIGMVLSTKNIQSESMIKHVAIAIGRAKEKGKNILQYYYPEMNAKAQARLSMESGLHHALKRDELVLYYQPQINARTGHLSGAEALVRWNHPQEGMIPPVDFIYLLEDTGLIIPIGSWILVSACRQWKDWIDAGHVSDSIAVSVNISSYQFRDAGFLNVVTNALMETQLPPECLELEITESILMEDTENCQNMLKQLKAKGIKISIDDFGTGYSSLAYLKSFPIDCLKIDQSFVKDVVDDIDDAAISSAIIGLAHNLRMTVIAEGVETQAIVDFLNDKGCDYHQGYFFSRPLSSEQFPIKIKDF